MSLSISTFTDLFSTLSTLENRKDRRAIYSEIAKVQGIYTAGFPTFDADHTRFRGINDTVTINNAIQFANSNGGGVVRLTPGKIYNVTGVNLLSNVTLDLNRATLQKSDSVITTSVVMMTGSTSSTTTTLTVDSPTASNSLSVTDSTGFSPGDICLLYDNTYKYGVGPITARNEQQVVINTVSVGVITLKTRTIGTYTVGSGATLVKLNSVTNAGITGKGNVIVPVGARGGCVKGVLCYECFIEDSFLSGAYDSPCARLEQSFGCYIRRNTMFDGQDQGSGAGHGYGFSLNNSCILCMVVNNHTRNLRENPFVTNNCRYNACLGNTVESNLDDGINTHGSGNESCLIADNLVDGCSAPGIIVGFNGSTATDNDMMVADNMVCNTKSHGIYAIGQSTSVRGNRVTIIGNIVRNWGLASPSSWAGIFSEQWDDITIHDNTCYGGNPNAFRGIWLLDVTQAFVTDNTVNSCVENIMYQNVTSIYIENNISRNASSKHIRSAGTNVDVLVKNNRSDSAVFTKQAGERWEDNKWGTKYDSDRGTANIADGGTINHNCYAAPNYVQVTPSVASRMASVTALAAGNFTVAIKKDDGTADAVAQNIYWEARVL